MNKRSIIVKLFIGVVMAVILVNVFNEESPPVFPDHMPKELLENSIKIDWPEDYEVLEFEDPKMYGHFKAKIQIQEKDIASFKQKLPEILNQYPSFSAVVEAWGAPSFDIEWGFNHEEFDEYYFAGIHGYDTYYAEATDLKLSYPQTNPVWLFITKPENGYCIIYICYI